MKYLGNVSKGRIGSHRLCLVLLTVWPAAYASGGERNKDVRVVAYVTSGSGVIPDADDITNINYAFGHVNETLDGVTFTNPPRLQRLVKLKEKNSDLEVMLRQGNSIAQDK